jgi:hypothetical protein
MRGLPSVVVEESDFYVLPNHKAHEDLVIEEQIFEESHSCQVENDVPAHDKKWTSMTEELRAHVKLLDDFVSDAEKKQVSENSLTHVHSVVSDLVKGLEILSLKTCDIPEMSPCERFAPNEKLKTQLSQLSSFKRPLKRKRKADSAVLSEKKKIALESLLQYHDAEGMNADDKDDEADKEMNSEDQIEQSFTLPTSYVDDPTDVIFTCGEENISLIHLKSLEIKLSEEEENKFRSRDPAFKVGWLYTTIIDSYLYKLSTSHKHVLYLSCDFATRASLGRSNADIIMKKINRAGSNIAMILLPANLTGDHWVILVVLLQNQEICYYDPLHLPISQRCIMLLKQTVSDMKNIFPASLTWKIKVEKFTDQSDTFNCGPLVCSFAKQSITAENSALVSPSEFRKEMYATVVGNCLRRSSLLEESCGKCGVSYTNDQSAKVWICCTQCQQWFHESCVHDPKFLNSTVQFVCP